MGQKKCHCYSEVSSFQRLKCTQEWYILGVGKGVLFREVSSVQECPYKNDVLLVCVLQVYFANVHPKFPEGGKMSQYLESLKVSNNKHKFSFTYIVQFTCIYIQY